MPGSVSLGTVHVSLEMRLQKFQQGIRDAKRDLSSFETSLERLASNTQRIGSRLSLGLTAPILLLGREAAKTAVKLDSLNMGIRAVDGQATDLGKTLKDLDQIAKLPGLGLVQVREGYVNLRAAGIQADFAKRSLMAFGNALATVGKGKEALDGVNYAMVQLANRTSGFGQEIRQLQNWLPQIRQAMIKAFGTAESEIIAKSGITGIQFLERITQYFETLPKVTGGARNALENFDDSLIRLKESIGKALLPSLIRWMDELTPKIEAASRWFNRLSPAAQETFTNMTVALAAGGPLMVGLGALAGALANIKKALDAIAATAAFKALFSVPGAVAAGTLGLGYFLSAGPGAGQRQNERAAVIGQTWGLAPGYVPPKVPLPPMNLGTGTAFGLLAGQIPIPKGEAPKASPPFKPLSLGKTGTKADETARRIAEINRQAQYELADPVKQAFMDMADNLASGMSRQNARALFRKRLNEILEDLNKEAFAISKKDSGLLTTIMLGDGTLTPQFVSTLRETIRDLRVKLGPVIDIGVEEMWKLRTERLGKAGPDNLSAAEVMDRLDAIFGGALADTAAKVQGRGVGIGQNLIQPKDIGDQLAQAAKEAKGEANRFTFPLGQELGSNLASEMGQEFTASFDRVFGTKSPLARALSRTFGRLIDDLLYTIMQRAFGQKLILSLFGGAGGTAVAGAAGGAAAGAAGASAAGGAAATGAVSKAGFSAGMAWSAAFAVAATWGVSRALASIFRGTPQGRANLQGQFAARPGMQAQAMGLMNFSGMPVVVNFHGANFNGKDDPRRVASSVAWHVANQMRVRPGS